MRYLGLFVLIYAFISISGMLFVGLILTSFYLKKIVHNMDEAKWNAYFKSMNNTAYLIRFWIVYLISLIATVVVEYYVLLAFGFECALLLSVLTMIVAIIKMIIKFRDRMSEVLEKIDKIRSI